MCPTCATASFDVDPPAGVARPRGHRSTIPCVAGGGEREHGLELTEPDGRGYDLVVGAVAHRDYRELADDRLAGLLAPGGMLADLKGMWRERRLDPALDRWTL